MQNFEIPMSIWINAGLLVAGAAFIWFRLATEAANRPGKVIRFSQIDARLSAGQTQSDSATVLSPSSSQPL